MEMKYFKTPAAFRKWLEKHHRQQTELVVGFYKVGSGKASLTWPESVDQALCFGWIDGVRKSVDENSYCIRFTPRKSGSTWSAINIRKMEELTQAGLVTPAGEKAFALRKESRSRIYAHENVAPKLSPAYQKLFKANKPAWKFFDQQAPSYKKLMTHWILGARQEKTRLSRLEKVINASAQQQKIT